MSIKVARVVLGVFGLLVISVSGVKAAIVTKPVATSVPAGCVYKQVTCVRAPCPRVLVCPTATPTKAPTCRMVMVGKGEQTVACGDQGYSRYFKFSCGVNGEVKESFTIGSESSCKPYSVWLIESSRKCSTLACPGDGDDSVTVPISGILCVTNSDCPNGYTCSGRDIACKPGQPCLDGAGQCVKIDSGVINTPTPGVTKEPTPVVSACVTKGGYCESSITSATRCSKSGYTPDGTLCSRSFYCCVPKVTPTPVVRCETWIKGDINCDGKINTSDLLIWQKERQTYNLMVREGKDTNKMVWKSDLNSDKKVDMADFTIWRNGFMDSFLRPTAKPSAKPTVGIVRCLINSDCGLNQECYQPSMPTCSKTAGACVQVMPAKYCRAKVVKTTSIPTPKVSLLVQ